MQEKRKRNALIRIESEKKDKLCQAEMSKTKGRKIPNPFDTELQYFANKYHTSVENLSNWMEYYSITIEQMLAIKNERENDGCEQNFKASGPKSSQKILKRIRSLGKQLVSIDMIFTTENQQCI